MVLSVLAVPQDARSGHKKKKMARDTALMTVGGGGGGGDSTEGRYYSTIVLE